MDSHGALSKLTGRDGHESFWWAICPRLIFTQVLGRVETEQSHNPDNPEVDNWQPLQVFVYKPLHKIGNFFGLGPGGLVLDDKAVELLRTFVEMSGELLAVHFDDQVCHLWNVTECIAALDGERTTWHVPNVRSLIDWS